MNEDVTDEAFMSKALRLAKEAAENDEVPVGALIVRDGNVIATGLNRREATQDATEHAEIMAIKDACKKLQSWRLVDCDVYVTLEPCLMCAGALYQARVRKVVFATRDPKGGAMGSLYHIHNDERLNHQMEVTEGIHREESRNMLSAFFKKKRK